jgi:hypothetical protein
MLSMRFAARLDTSHHGPPHSFKYAWNPKAGLFGMRNREKEGVLQTLDVRKSALESVDRDAGVRTRQTGEELDVSQDHLEGTK